jgi:Ulp1 family protease
LDNFTATRQSWTRSFSKAEVEEAALAVSPAKALENYIHAQGHDLQDILKGNKLTGEAVDSLLVLVAAKAQQNGITVYPVCHKFYTFMATGNYIAEQWIPDSGLGAYKFILVPIVENDHWTLAVIQTENLTFCFLDSVFSTHQQKHENIVR